MRRLLRTVLLTATVLAGPAAVAAPQTADRVALVIGNSAYRTQNVLANPVNDATDIGAMFRKLGFEVVEGLDLDAAGMKEKLKEFRDKLDGRSLAVFYYAGHGMQVDGHNYIVPIDAKVDKPDDLRLETVDMDLVLQLMRADDRISVVVLDACRDSPFTRSLRRGGKAATRSAESAYGGGLAPVASTVGSVIVYATDPGAVAQDGEGRNSPFTEAFLRNAATPGVDFHKVVLKVRFDVVQATGSRQVPWETSTLVNDIYLAGGGPAPVQTAAYTPAPPTAPGTGRGSAEASGDAGDPTPPATSTAPATPAAPPAAPAAPTAAELCDRLASDQQDTLRNPAVGLVRTVDAERAIPACEKAVEENPKELRFANQLGRAYSRAERWPDALRVFKAAADRGSAYATGEVGYLYYRGFGGVKKDYAQARPWFEKAAQLGVPMAMTNLAYMYAHGIGTERNLDKSLMWLRRAEAIGWTGAMVTLGESYIEGTGVPKDVERGVALIRRAVDLDDPEAMVELALLHQRGVGVAQDYDAARRWLEKAAAYDSANGMYNLGFYYLKGDGGVPRDFAIARDWFKRSVHHDGNDALIGLAHMRLNGLGEPADPKGARELLERAATYDNAAAMTYLAEKLRDGAFGEIDETAARDWLKRAIALDSDEARRLLAEMDRPETPGQTCDRLAAIESDPLRPPEVKGLKSSADIVHARAVPACEAAVKAAPTVVRYADQLGASYVSAERWADARRVFEGAAKKKSAFAALWMGNIVDRGLGGPKDAAAARKWWEQAAAQGSRNAMYNLGVAWADGSGGPADPTRALHWYEKAAAAGERDAVRQVGDAHYFGRGTPENNTRARDWYEKAADMGDAVAKRRLGEIWHRGNGVKADPILARRWYQRAAADGDAVAMRELADLYLNGIGGDREPLKARGLLEQAADDGNVGAMNRLAQYLLAGAVGPVDEEGARGWYQKAADAGDETAKTWLAVHAPAAAPDLSKGDLCDAAAGAAEDPLRSVGHPPVETVDAKVAIPACEAAHAADPSNLRWADQLGRAYLFGNRALDSLRVYREAAEAGSAYATLWVGNFHLRGMAGLTTDGVEARKWWEKAAALGAPNAMFNVGITLMELAEPGPKYDTDLRTARGWFEKAAALGESSSMLHLAQIYRDGLGVPADRAKYRDWLHRAAEFGNTQAMRHLAFDLHAGADGRTDDVEARRFLEKAVAGGDIGAHASLAVMLIEGWGGPKDVARARTLLDRAVAGQNQEGIRTLAQAHEKGFFGKVDKAEARRLYRLAADLGDEASGDALKRLK